MSTRKKILEKIPSRDWPLIAVFVAFIQISAPKHAQIAKIKALLLKKTFLGSVMKVALFFQFSQLKAPKWP